MLTESVDVGILRQFGAQSNVLGLENELLAACVKQNLPRFPARNCKGEGVFNETKLQLGRILVCFALVWTGEV